MAERPVFVPQTSGSRLVETVMVSFTWLPGMSPVQKKRNVTSLHQAAQQIGLYPLLETSSKSEYEAGRRLSAFFLPIDIGGIRTTVECAFQGSKVFERGGPYSDLYRLDSRSAKLDPRLQNSGKLTGFQLEGRGYPLSPPSVFYDWLYTNALLPHRAWLLRLNQFAGFTDIEFNPQRSLNCQARACALFVALERRGLLDTAMANFDSFIDMQVSTYL